MLITLQDDHVVRVYAAVEDVTRDIEALDAETSLRAIFDETGEVYRIKWLKPNSRGRFLRFMVENGEYTLTATGKKDIEGLLTLLRDSEHVDPPEARQTLFEIQKTLPSRRES